MYFSKFTEIQYDPIQVGKGKAATNILNSLLLQYNPVTNATQYQYHTVKDGESPESLAFDYYDNVEYHWILVLLNNIVDPYFDWPLDAQRFDAFMTMKYGAGNENRLNHFINLTNDDKRVDEVEHLEYVDSEGDVAPGLPQHISPVSNREYELELNDVKRQVKILRPKYVQSFVNHFEDLMNRNVL